MKKDLTEEQRKVLLEGGTEAPFSGKYVHEKGKGMYRCAACGAELFASDTKFDSGTGWPSFDDAIPGAVTLHQDDTDLPAQAGGMYRTEVRCAKCGGHLGHVFDDGPAATTGKRYCINSVCLDLESGKN